MLKRIYTSAEVREIDKYAAEHLSLPTAVLMENAGRAVAAVAMELLQSEKRDGVIVVCGKGNNGGDGYVAARHLAAMGIQVRTKSLGKITELKGDARRNAEAARACGVREVDGELANFHGKGFVVVDALFGTGLMRPPEGVAGELIGGINALRDAGSRVVAVDVPSGLDADRPHPPGIAVLADVTVALHCLKPAHVQFPARRFCGEIRVEGIGLPDTSPSAVPRRVWLESSDVAAEVEPRASDAHKGTAGHVLVVAGAPGKSGAAFMSCAAALRSGAGLVTLASAGTVIDGVLPQLPEAMGHALERIEKDALLEALDRKNALVIGPGIARDDRTGGIIADVLRNADLPAIVDADGLNALAQSPDALKALTGAKIQPVLTPHPAELARLLQCTTEDVQKDRLASATEAARRFNAHVVLKGACSVIAHPDGSLAVNSTGNAAMATAGMGDVLSGIVGALLGQRLAPTAAAEVATYVHGRAGDLAAKGDRGLIATDVIAQLPAAFAEVTKQ